MKRLSAVTEGAGGSSRLREQLEQSLRGVAIDGPLGTGRVSDVPLQGLWGMCCSSSDS